MHFCFIAIQSTLLTSARCSIIKSMARATKFPKVPLTYSSGMFPDIGFHDGVSVVNSLWPGDAIWQHGARSTLAQVMACYQTAPSHYLNQCWLTIDGAHSHSSQGIIIRQYEDTNQENEIENCSYKMASRSPRGQSKPSQIFIITAVVQHATSHYGELWHITILKK